MDQHYRLEQLGWRDSFRDQLNEQNADLIPARVIRQDINRYQLLSEQGPLIAILPGRTRAESGSRGDLPAVGDWVLCSPADDADPASVVITQTLKRFSKFSRKEAGDRFDEQIVAANIDTVFLVTGLDDNFNLNRIERYLLLAWNSGAAPVIVLSKVDVAQNLEEKLEQLESVAMGTPILVISALEGRGMEQLMPYVTEGKTVALLGSSGVGKSTIINTLLGYDRFDTGGVRAGDSKGRHTTTFRELCMVASGGMLIDTPGMREIQIWSDDGEFSGGFEDIEDLAMRCRFTDCKHESEPGCAITEAIAGGQLEASRLESYQKFQREVTHFAAKQDANLKAAKQQERRRFTKQIRNRPTKRDE